MEQTWSQGPNNQMWNNEFGKKSFLINNLKKGQT
jgi:hypothetical protein